MDTVSPMYYGVQYIIYQTRKTMFHHISKPEKKVKNTTCSSVFLTNFEVFGNVVKHGLECLIYIFSIETETKDKTEK